MKGLPTHCYQPEPCALLHAEYVHRGAPDDVLCTLPRPMHCQIQSGIARALSNQLATRQRYH